MNAGWPMNSVAWLWFGWLMFHVLWIGALAAAFGVVLRRQLQTASPETRYAASLVVLLAIVLSPFAAARFIDDAQLDGRVLDPGAARLASDVQTPLTPSTESQSFPTHRHAAPNSPEHAARGTLRGTTATHGSRGWQTFLAAASAESRRFVGWLPVLWLCGMPLALVHFALGLAGTVRLRRSCRPVALPEIAALADRLRRVHRVPLTWSLAACDRIKGPLVLGVLRPVVLLPAAALAGWTPAQIEMALLHELAHIRRHDNLVNLLQRLAECVLFFHPALWWASAWVRLEREHCCDAFVVRQTSRPREYATFLAGLFLDPHRVRPLEATAGMAEAHAVVRVRAILASHADHHPGTRRSYAAAVLLAAVLLAALGWCSTPGTAMEAKTDDPSIAIPPDSPRAVSSETHVRSVMPARPAETVATLVRDVLETAAPVDVDRAQNQSDAIPAVHHPIATITPSQREPRIDDCGLSEVFRTAGCLFGQSSSEAAAESTAGPLQLRPTRVSPGFRQFTLQSGRATAAITSAAWIPGTRYILVGTHASGVLCCDLDSGETRVLERASQNAWAVAAAGTGESLAAAGLDGRVLVWDGCTHRLVAQFQACGSIRALAFSPDGTLLAAPLFDTTVGREGVRVWNLESQRVAGHWPCTGDGSSIAFSADGKRLAANGRLWRTADGAPLAALSANYGPLSLCPDGTRLIGGDPLVLQDVAGTRPEVPLDDTRVYITAAAFSHDGQRFALCANDGTVRLWNAHSGRELAAMQLPESAAARDASFSPSDQELVILHADGTVSLLALVPCAIPPQPL